MGHQQLCYWPSTVAAALVIIASVATDQDASSHPTMKVVKKFDGWTLIPWLCRYMQYMMIKIYQNALRYLLYCMYRFLIFYLLRNSALFTLKLCDRVWNGWCSTCCSCSIHESNFEGQSLLCSSIIFSCIPILINIQYEHDCKSEHNL